MKKVKFSLIRTIELQSFQEIELTDEQVKQFEDFEYDDDKINYLCNLNKINYDFECEDDTISAEIQGLEIEDIEEKNDSK